MMAGAAHSADFAKRVGVPQSVAQEFNKADARTGILKRKKKGKAPGKMIQTESDKEI
jgi:hypothetical protein